MTPSVLLGNSENAVLLVIIQTKSAGNMQNIGVNMQTIGGYYANIGVNMQNIGG